MNHTGAVWSLILAAGEGSRLRVLTTTAKGIAIPKQFCSLRGGPSLLQEALRRGTSVASADHTCVIVARQHRVWWQMPLHDLPNSNIIVQPENRGTGNGILFSLLHIVARDPEAIIVLLPSDHHVSHEPTMRRALRDAVEQVRADDDAVILLGLEPDEVDCELGYIVPDKACDGIRAVEYFVEKPSMEQTRKLIATGALWNAFIIAARAASLLNMFEQRYPNAVERMKEAVQRDAQAVGAPMAAAELYEHLEPIDFSRDVLQEFPERLRVLTVPACGWSDLGTPARVARTLDRMLPVEASDESVFPVCHPLNLAEQHSLRRARA